MMEKFWAIVELFGHNKIAGEVSEETIGGAAFIRVDVPSLDDLKGYTKFYNGSAIYAISPCAEEIARAHVAYHRPRPISIYELEGRLLSQRATVAEDEEF